MRATAQCQRRHRDGGGAAAAAAAACGCADGVYAMRASDCSITLTLWNRVRVRVE